MSMTPSPARLIAVVLALLVAACGDDDATTPATDPTAVTTETTATNEPAEPAETGDTHFDIAAIGPDYDVEPEPYEPAPPRPSDCALLDAVRERGRAWLDTEYTVRTGGALVGFFTGRAPSEEDAADFLEDTTAMTNSFECSTISYDDGGTAEMFPATTRRRQAFYDFATDGYPSNRIIVTIDGPHIVTATVFESDEHPDIAQPIADEFLRQTLDDE